VYDVAGRTSASLDRSVSRARGAHWWRRPDPFSEPHRDVLQRGPLLFLRDTGRKRLHLDRQLSTDDAVLDDLRSYLK
jgi:hypothetical protein